MTIMEPDGVIVVESHLGMIERLPACLTWYYLLPRVRAAIARRRYSFGRRCE